MERLISYFLSQSTAFSWENESLENNLVMSFNLLNFKRTNGSTKLAILDLDFKWKGTILMPNSLHEESDL